MFPHETGRHPAGRDNLQVVAGRGADAARLRAILVFAAVVEFGTGLALIAAPAVVVRLLLGAELGDTGVLVGRCFGIALLLALYLAYLGTVGQLGGLLLWPAAALHAAVALVWAWP